MEQAALNKLLHYLPPEVREAVLAVLTVQQQSQFSTIEATRGLQAAQGLQPADAAGVPLRGAAVLPLP